MSLFVVINCHFQKKKHASKRIKKKKKTSLQDNSLGQYKKNQCVQNLKIKRYLIFK